MGLESPGKHHADLDVQKWDDDCLLYSPVHIEIFFRIFTYSPQMTA